ncbi:MAG: hypothetical protein ACLTAI_06040 [Thomasclavelia sp.]
MTANKALTAHDSQEIFDGCKRTWCYRFIMGLAVGGGIPVVVPAKWRSLVANEH